VYKKVWWIAGPADLVRLQTLQKFQHWVQLFVRYRYRTEPDCTMLERMNIPVCFSSQSRFVATVIIYKKVRWIRGQLYLVRLQTLSNFHAEFNSVQYRYRTEPDCTMLEHMNIPIWFSYQSSLVATVIICKKVWWMAGHLDLVRLQTLSNFHAEFNSVPYRYRTEPYCTML